MKKTFILLSVLMISLMLSAQTQQGYVKTKGRMVNGKLVPGQGLKGAMVSIKGRTTVLVKADDGAFSFPVPEAQFHVDSVRKEGYQLVDMDALSQTYNCSANPLYLVMETPEQQLQDQLTAERKIRRTLTEQLHQREDEIEALKEQQKISDEEYRQALQKLYEETDQNEQLVKDMVERYSKIDYDQLSEFDQQISEYILNGELSKADSLLNTKGNFNKRLADYWKHNAINAKEREELRKRQNQLEQSEALSLQEREELANDCYRKFEIFKMQHLYDSAGFYIKTRATLNSANIDYLLDVADFCNNQNEFAEAESYYLEVLSLIDILNVHYMIHASEHIHSPQINNYYLKATLGLASIYSCTHNYTKSEQMYSEALEKIRPLAKENPDLYSSGLAEVINNLAIVYFDIYQANGNKEIGEKCEAMYMEALNIKKQLAKENHERNEPTIATILNNLGNFYSIAKKHKESEAALVEALEIRRRLAKSNPADYEYDLASTLLNLGVLYKDTQRPEESEAMYMESLEIFRRLATTNPKVYNLKVASVLYNLGILYFDNKRYQECETALLEAITLYRILATGSPQLPENRISSVLYKQLVISNSQPFDNNWVTASLILASITETDNNRHKETEALYLEALEIYKRLANDNPQTYEPNMALLLYKLGTLYLSNRRYNESETAYQEAVGLYRRLSNDDNKYDLFLAEALKTYGLIKIVKTQYQEAFTLYTEALEIYKKNAAIDASQRQQCENLYNALLKLCIVSRQYEHIDQYVQEAMAFDPNQKWIYTSHAIALLFQGKYTEAEQIYRQYKDELRDILLQDLNDFETAGAIPEERKADVERFKKMLTDE